MGKEDSFSGFVRGRFSVLQGLRVVFLHDIMGVKSLCNRIFERREHGFEIGIICRYFTVKNRVCVKRRCDTSWNPMKIEFLSVSRGC